MNKLTYKITPSCFVGADGDWIHDWALYTSLWMNGHAIIGDVNQYSTKWAAKRGLGRICKLLADNVKVVNIGVY